MKVFRVEHPATRQGPYNPGAIPERDRVVLDGVSGAIDTLTAHHPAPDRDGLPFHTCADGWLYGFTTDEQLNAWFPPRIRADLFHAGFRLTAYDVPEDQIQHGGHQCRFLAPSDHPVWER